MTRNSFKHIVSAESRVLNVTVFRAQRHQWTHTDSCRYVLTAACTTGVCVCVCVCACVSVCLSVLYSFAANTAGRHISHYFPQILTYTPRFFLFKFTKSVFILNFQINLSHVYKYSKKLRLKHTFTKFPRHFPNSITLQFLWQRDSRGICFCWLDYNYDVEDLRQKLRSEHLKPCSYQYVNTFNTKQSTSLSSAARFPKEHRGKDNYWQ